MSKDISIELANTISQLRAVGNLTRSAGWKAVDIDDRDLQGIGLVILDLANKLDNLYAEVDE